MRITISMSTEGQELLASLRVGPIWWQAVPQLVLNEVVQAGLAQVVGDELMLVKDAVELEQEVTA